MEFQDQSRQARLEKWVWLLKKTNHIFMYMFKSWGNQFWNPVYQWVSSWGGRGVTLRRYGPRPRNNNNNPGSLTKPPSTCAGMKYRGRHKPSLRWKPSDKRNTELFIKTLIDVITYPCISYHIHICWYIHIYICIRGRDLSIPAYYV